ncbi:methyltransferase family protein [Murinocardiopsis flavida]|uniref:Methyltransferase family protein n=1 Tax=Murinocardiopsis flavida TaxID=645275 RepID=A0A2P8DLC6_9ACTN|nr:methyltransferase domain-containing protein [Murinocardiopsis flavida]PSK98027.1 methyltransferase family protein [Murinocardiopsis flavida]
MTSTSLKQRLTTQVVRQFGRPRGVLGRLAGWVMAHRATNRRRNLWVVSLLDVRPTDRVLEVGFGPGLAIAELARHASRGRVYGIDHSDVMTRRARRRNAAAIRAGRVDLRHAPVDRLPHFDTPLDAVVAVNSLGFWPDPVRRLGELRGLLRPGGRIALAGQPRCAGATADTTARAGRELHDLLTRAGFTRARVETLPLSPPVACVLAVNPVEGGADHD